MPEPVKPQLRIRANVSENVKGLVSCDVTVEVVNDFLGDMQPILQDNIAYAIEYELDKMHRILRERGHKLAVDNGEAAAKEK